MKVKVCGMRDPQNITEVAGLHPDYMGFIFYPQSKRYAGSLSVEVASAIAPEVRKTGVFVNDSLAQIFDIVARYDLAAVQLHGGETPQLCEQLRKKGSEVIKAFGIDDSFNFESLEKYADVVDYFLFDTKTSGYGGSGRSFNWEILNHYQLPKPYFLSGGLNSGNIMLLQQMSDDRLFGADLNSGFETSPGIKNISELQKAFNLLRP